MEPFNLRGLKFYQFEEGHNDPTVLRLISYDEVKKEYTLLKEDYMTKVKIPLEELYNKWIKLNPDGCMNFMCCTAVDNQNDEVPDVMVTLHRINKDTRVIEPTPYAVCRQAVIDIFALLQSKNTRYIAGMSISQDTCPPEIGFASFYSFAKKSHTVTIAIYMDDKLPNILKLFNNNKFNDRLRLIKSRDKMGVPGYCTTLYDMLHENYFMLDFHEAFHVHEMKFDEFDFENSQTNRTITDYIMSNTQEVPTKFYPVKYTKMIDLEDVRRKYILICPSSYEHPYGEITLVGYDISTTISFKDMINHGRSPKEAKKEAMRQLGWE